METLEKLIEISDKRIFHAPKQFYRPAHSKIDWSERLICIKGPRGVGKTTVVLQHLANCFKGGEALYISLDNVWVNARELYEIAEYHHSHGGTHLFLDEVHQLEGWQKLVKSLYDDIPGLSIVYTGSSLLKMESKGGDLSRRQVVYGLPGLSFREYLAFEKLIDVGPFALEEVLAGHVEIAKDMVSGLKILKAFDDYRAHGYYPFYREGLTHYEERIVQTVNQVLECDYPAIDEVEVSTVRKARRMLNVLAQSTPQTPNMDRLYRDLGTQRPQGLKMLYALERAGLLSMLSTERAKLKTLATPDKIYCDNTNLMNALVPNPNDGTARETFFLNQLRAAGHEVAYPDAGDFIVDGRFLFEVGGEGKGFAQIKDRPDSYVVNDNVEFGKGNKIPLWMLGLLY